MRITYHAAPGDDAQVEYLGLTLHDGVSVEIPADADPKWIAKAKQNPRFAIAAMGLVASAPAGLSAPVSAEVRRGPGRPPKASE